MLRISSMCLFQERETGLEPATSSLGSWHSTTELLPQSFFGFFRLFSPFSPLFRPAVQQICNKNSPKSLLSTECNILLQIGSIKASSEPLTIDRGGFERLARRGRLSVGESVEGEASQIWVKVSRFRFVRISSIEATRFRTR